MTEIIITVISSGLALVGVIITTLYGNKQTKAQMKQQTEATKAQMKQQTDLTLYRIDQLEKKVEKHNNVIERVYALEKQEAVIEEEIKVANHRIEDLEEFHK